MTITATRVLPASSADSAAVVEIMSRGFAADPIFAWMLDDPETRPQYTRAFFQVFAPFFIEQGTAELDSERTAAALWLPVDPDVEPDDAALGEQLAEAAGPHIERLGIIDELMKAAHPHDRAHAYLNFLSTVPEQQGKGLGAALLANRISELDATGTPAYLEATTLRSAALYQRFGFEHLPQTIDLPDGPSMYPMWREPASR